MLRTTGSNCGSPAELSRGTRRAAGGFGSEQKKSRRGGNPGGHWDATVGLVNAENNSGSP
jgi:hypothetical protein